MVDQMLIEETVMLNSVSLSFSAYQQILTTVSDDGKGRR
jgi:hypothetical protein